MNGTSPVAKTGTLPKSAGGTESNSQPLSYREIILFWTPLAVMWLMMAVEQPAITAVVARMADANANLAAFGVVFALSLMIESPIIQMMAAATSLTGNRGNYRLLLRFMHIMAVLLTTLHLVIGLTPAYLFIVERLLGVPPDVAALSRWPFVVMAPFAAAVGYRRLWQGALIRYGKTWVVPVTMITRLGSMAAILAWGAVTKPMSGAMLASTALAIAVTAAAIAAGVLNRLLVIPRLGTIDDTEPTFGMRSLLRFYIPLAMTSVVFLMARPLATFGIARALLPRESLAVWPVLNAFLFLFNSVALSYQEAAIALLQRSPESHGRLRRFTWVMAVSLASLLLLSGLTPIGQWWFSSISGLEQGLVPLTRLPVVILAIVPALAAMKAWYRAQYVAARRTPVLAQSVVLYTIVLFAVLWSGSSLVPIVGTVLASAALAIAQAAENGYLLARRE